MFLIIGQKKYFQYCQLDQNKDKSQFLFHRNCSPRDLCILMTLYVDATCFQSVGFDKKLVYHKTFFSEKPELYKRFKLNGVKIVKLYLTSLLLSLRKMERKENKQIFVIGYMLNWFQRAIRDVVSTILNPKFQIFPIVTNKIWPFLI